MCLRRLVSLARLDLVDLPFAPDVSAIHYAVVRRQSRWRGDNLLWPCVCFLMPHPVRRDEDTEQVSLDISWLEIAGAGRFAAGQFP